MALGLNYPPALTSAFSIFLIQPILGEADAVSWPGGTGAAASKGSPSVPAESIHGVNPSALAGVRRFASKKPHPPTLLTPSTAHLGTFQLRCRHLWIDLPSASSSADGLKGEGGNIQAEALKSVDDI